MERETKKTRRRETSEKRSLERKKRESECKDGGTKLRKTSREIQRSGLRNGNEVQVSRTKFRRGEKTERENPVKKEVSEEKRCERREKWKHRGIHLNGPIRM